MRQFGRELTAIAQLLLTAVLNSAITLGVSVSAGSQMDNQFFDRPILNSPYTRPERHWELDEHGQPTQKIIESRRKADFITPIPKPRKRAQGATQQDFVIDEGKRYYASGKRT